MSLPAGTPQDRARLPGELRELALDLLLGARATSDSLAPAAATAPAPAPVLTDIDEPRIVRCGSNTRDARRRGASQARQHQRASSSGNPVRHDFPTPNDRSRGQSRFKC